MMQIQLHQNQTSFVPGNIISGTLSWADAKAGTAQIDVRLIWYTRGKGQRNHRVIDTHTIPNPENSGESRFEFAAPHRPYSFSGKLISLVWAIEAIMFPDLEAEQFEVTISPSGKEIILH